MASAGLSGDRGESWFYSGLIGRLDKSGAPTEGSLLAYAARELVLGALLDDGVTTQREAYASHIRQGGEPNPALEPVECASEVLYLWEWFCNMHARRTSSGFGPNPITEEGVMAWARRRGLVLERWEHGALDALEALYLSTRGRAK